MTNDIESKPERGGASRRDALKCMAWAGTGILWTVSGGVPRSLGLIGDAKAADVPTGGLTFVQISDTHLGFKGEANPDVPGTVRRAVEMINALPTRPAFVVHTGDITHLSKPQEFDDAAQLLNEIKVDRVHYIPGEHDMLDDGPAGYLKRYGAGKQGNGWFSFDHGGVHVVGLINVVDFKPKGLGVLGDEQLEWLEKDVANLPASTPVIVLAHMPLWSVYPEWGWGTDDAGRALGYLKKFGSVTVLNGHIHQIVQKVEGNVAFHTAMSMAYPQPKGGMGDGPGPLKVPAGELGKLLGIRAVTWVRGKEQLATIDMPLDRAG
jgi:3',5'-cyclic-AMP phosphodiesterase